MDSTKVLKHFDDIERKVAELLSDCNELKKNNIKLQRKTEYLEKELNIKIEKENRFVNERNLIRSKVDHLLEKLEGITEGDK